MDKHRYFILIEHTDYVPKNKLSAELQRSFLLLNKTVTDNLDQTISELRNRSSLAHSLHTRCKEIHFTSKTSYHTTGNCGLKGNDFYCGHWGVAIAKFYKINEEVPNG